MLAGLGLILALAGCGRVSEVLDEGSGGSAAGTGGDAVMDGTGSSGGGGATSGMDGGGGHQVNNCPDLTGLPSPPKKEIVPSYSDEALPTPQGGQIPTPSEFALTALRFKDSEKGLAIADDGALRFASNEHVEKFHWDAVNSYAWRIEKETKLVFNRTCYVDGVGFTGGNATYDYTYADDVLTLVLPKKDPPEIYTYKRIKK
jgi:hypothetical protein